MVKKVNYICHQIHLVLGILNSSLGKRSAKETKLVPDYYMDEDDVTTQEKCARFLKMCEH